MKSLYQKSAFRIFILGFLCALCIFLPFLVIDKGFFLYAGDFNSQQIPFYMNAVRAVQEGSMNWSWNTDLGSSFVTSYSFYLLGSPFFWLSCIFPYRAVPYLLPLWLMLKFAVAALGAFLFLRRYAKDVNFAFVGAILYAFSGFAVYNIFFNHFLEAVAFFPFLLWSLDEFVYNRRRGLFVVFVAVNLLNNYFFFAGQVVFLFIYFICKVITKEYSVNIKEFLLLAFESLLGCLCGIVLAVPSVMTIVNNPRSTQMHSGFALWLYDTVQQYLAILMSAFYPPDVPYSPTLFTDGDIKWTSLSAFVVMGGMFGYFIFRRFFKKSAFTKIFTCCIVFAFVPVLNSSFYAFNDNYYARWFYMPLLILAAMNMHSFTLCRKIIFYGLKITAAFTAVFCIYALTPIKDKDGVFHLGLQEETAVFWLIFMVSIISLYLAYAVVKNYRDTALYPQKLLIGTLVCVCLFGITHMALTKLPRNDANYIKQNYTVLDSFKLEDSQSNYRMDAYQCYSNLGLFLDKPVIQFFNSTVSPSVMDFYPYVGVSRTVSSKPPYENYALRSLLSVKYLLTPTHELENFYENEGYADIYREHSIIRPYNILENKYFIPMGFTYDYFVTPQQMNTVKKENRSNIMLRAVMVDETLVDVYKLSLEKLSDTSLEDTSFSAFESDVADRNLSAAHYFEQTKDGFVSEIYLDHANLVFYSVPFDEGFTAYVNGHISEIIEVNNGMSAVYAPAGENEIVFTYETPYLKTGIFLNFTGLGIYIIYSVLILKKKVKI